MDRRDFLKAASLSALAAGLATDTELFAKTLQTPNPASS
ncbi:MAG: twin-arginine translocation signal domain-containing protein, partial [Bryobacteraceae bacterium]